MTRTSGSNILATPCCRASVTTPAYSSLNFSAQAYWTDGGNVFSLAPLDGGLRHCTCGSYFLLSQAEFVARIPKPKPPAPVGWESKKDTWWSRLIGQPTRQSILANYDTRLPSEIDAREKSRPPPAAAVTDEQTVELVRGYDKALKGNADLRVKGIDSDVLAAARRRCWRIWNNPFRDLYRAHREATNKVDAEGDSASFPDYQPNAEQTGNMWALLVWHQASSKPDWLEVAELHRELGDMQAASDALNQIEGKEKRLAIVLRKLVALKVRGPVRFFY